jgi:hypothetical protein
MQGGQPQDFKPAVQPVRWSTARGQDRETDSE